MKKGLNPFKSIPLVDVEEKIECLACAGEAVYVGTAQGTLIQYTWPIGDQEEITISSAKKHAAVKLDPKAPKRVEQVLASSELVFALADGALTVLPSDLSKVAKDGRDSPGTILVREVKKMCLHTGAVQEGTQRQIELCVAIKKRLGSSCVVLYKHDGRQLVPFYEMNLNEAPTSIVWHSSWICVGDKKQYTLYSASNSTQRDICQIAGFSPQIAVLPNNELLLLIQESAGIFFNLNQQQPSNSPKNPVHWPRKLVNMSAVGNYIFGSTGNGQIDIFAIRDQKNCQTLTLEGTTIAMAGINGRLVVATESSLTCLDPIPYDHQLQKLLLQVRVADALSLLNTHFSSDDPKLEEQLSRFHALAGWTLFKDLQFSKAFQHFLYTPHLNIARVLAFWKKYLPASWDAAAASRQGKPAFTDNAPEPCDMEEFVRKRLEERQSDSGAPSSSATILANHNMANATMASFLLKQRDALHTQERLPPDQRILGLSSIDMTQLMRAVDTLIVKLLIEADTDDLTLQEVLNAGVHCTIDDCETFLRERERLDILARLWKAQGMYDLVLEEWSRFLSGNTAGNARSTKAQAIAEMSDALRSAAGTKGSVDLLRKYVPTLLSVEPSSVMPIFTQMGQQALTVDEVLQLLGSHSELVLAYLEHAVETRKTTDLRHRTKLALLYVVQLEDDRSKGREIAGVEQCAARQKLLRFLETTVDINVHEILPRCEALHLDDECVVLHNILQQYLEALRVFVVKLDDLTRAERYCRILMARSNRLIGVSTSSSSVSPSDLSVLCSDPPDWARGIAFGTRNQRVDTLDEEQVLAAAVARATASSTDELLLESGGESPRPLMFFVKVLLDASLASAEKPDSFTHPAKVYQEHAITLLTAYAGHPDLPPSEVIGMLPSSWTVSSLSTYLSRSARTCLHEKRSTLLEENLSSMAYLKTFSTWANERKRKVHITGDKCCPVCNRRFVDKDSVGKAFVAYPNETCVHLQCKEKDHICPKTGRNFADNASVYAFGADLIG